MPGRWTRKPPYGTPIDRSHPLVAGLQGLYAINEGGGPTLWDATGRLAAATVGSPVWAPAAAPGLKCVGAGVGASAAVPSSLQSSLPLSLAVGFRHLGAASNFVPIFGLMNTGSTRIASFEVSSSGTANLTSTPAGSNISTTSAALAVGTDYVLSGTLDGTNELFYVNGSFFASAAIAVINWGASPTVQVAASGAFFAGRTINTLIYWCAWWNRVLSVQEHLSIGASPAAIWQAFRPRHDTLFIFGTGAGGASCVGAMGVTLAPATFAGSAGLATSAALAATLGADTFAGSAAAGATGSMGVTLAPATFAGSAGLATSAALAATLGADTFAGSASGGGTGGGPWVLVESLKVETGSTTGPVTGTFVSAVASGDLVVVSASLYTTATQGTVTITDNAAGGSNTYTEAAKSTINGGNWAAIDYSVVARGGSGFAVSLNFSVAQFTGISFLHYTNTGTPITFDAGNAQTGTGATGSAPVVAAGAGELAIGQLATALAGLTYTPGPGFAVEQSGVLGTHEPFATIDDLSSPSGTVMPSVGISTPGNWAFASALFRVPTAGASASLGVTLSAATFAGSVAGPASAAMAVTLAPAILVGAGVGGVVSFSVVDPSAGTLIEPAAAPQSAPAPIATTFAIRWYMTLASDHSSPSAVIPTVLLCGPGSGWFTPAGTLSYLGAGEWEIAATAPDQSRGWPLILWATAAGADGQPGWYAPPGWGWPQGVTAASLPVWLGTAASGGWLPAEGILPTWVFTRPEGGPSAAGTGTFARPAGVGQSTYGWSWYYPSAADVAAAGELAIRAGATGAVDWTATYPIAATGLVVLPAPPPPPAATGGGSQVNPSEGTVILI